ncbi:MAG: tetratricopeptide repeat protein, partial [Vicinamibacteria bacterium]
MFTLLAFLLAIQDPLQLGRQALAIGKLDEAEAHLEAALAGNPPRVFEVHYALGRLHLMKRDYPRALESFDACLARAPRFAPALVNRARASFFLGDLERGLADLGAAQALPEPPPEAAALETDVETYRGPREIPETQDLSSARDYLHRGAYYLSRGETEKALRALRVAQSIDDQNPISFLLLKKLGEAPPPFYPELSSDFALAREAYQRGDFDRASAGARSILERRPLFVPARLMLLEAAEREKRFVDALVEYEKLLLELPETAELYARSARIAYTAEAYELAECHAARALELDPDDAALFFLLAEAELGAGKAEEAIATCERAIESGIVTAPIYFTLGNALHTRMEIAASIE